MIILEIGKKFQLDTNASSLFGYNKEMIYRVVGISGNVASIQIGEKTMVVAVSRLLDHSKNVTDVSTFKSVNYIPSNMLAAQEALRNKETPMPKPEVINPDVITNKITVGPVTPSPSQPATPTPLSVTPQENVSDVNKDDPSKQDNNDTPTNPYGGYIQ
jgi:hypothetical protein